MTSPLSEALAQHNEGLAGTHQYDELAIAAHILLAGQPTEWCETHKDIKEAPSYPASYPGCRRGMSFQCPAGSKPCHITSKLLCTPPTDQS
jgi:hypothetical protein